MNLVHFAAVRKMENGQTDLYHTAAILSPRGEQKALFFGDGQNTDPQSMDSSNGLP